MVFLLSCEYTAVVGTLVLRGFFDPRSLRLPFGWEVAGSISYIFKTTEWWCRWLLPSSH